MSLENVLHVVRGAATTTHVLPSRGTLSIGRGADNDVHIDDPSVSRRHALLHVGPPLAIEDLGSRNGTRLRRHAGEPLESEETAEFPERPSRPKLLYIADEVFLTGSAAEVTPVRSVDKITVGAGKRGPITEKIQRKFFGLFDGSTADEWGWLEPMLDAPAGRSVAL